MAKVDWITWKTDPKEIINPEKIREEMEEYYDNYESFMSPLIYDQLNNEVKRGGLTKEAFNVSGISPANEMAEDILRKIEEVKHTMDNLKEIVTDIAKEQKKTEKQQLIDAIEEKIKKEKLFLKNIEERENVKDNITKMGSNPEDIISIINDRIHKLTERLNQAQSL